MTVSPYDPELPFLADLERAVHAQAVRAAKREAAQAIPLSTPRRAKRRALPPVPAVRRVAIMLALLCVIATTALGTRSIFFTSSPPPGPRTSAPVQLAAGGASGDRWSLQVYARGRELCRELVLDADEVASRCAPAPTGDAVGATSAASATRRYVFGLAGGSVRAVQIQIGAAQLTAYTRSAGAAQGGAIGAPASLRYFVASLPRPSGASGPIATITPLDGQGRRLRAHQRS